MKGGLMTGSHVYEWQGPKAVGKGGYGVIRKPGGSMLVFVPSEMQNTLQLKDGKVVGFNATGQGTYTFASGDAASLNGRTYSYVAKPTGPGRFRVDTTYDWRQEMSHLYGRSAGGFGLCCSATRA